MRGALLIAAAVILGAGLLARSFDSGGPLNTGGTTGTTPRATAPASTTTTTVIQPHDPSQVKVLVLNGSGKTGIATEASNSLKAANYTTLEPGNSAETATSIVYFVPGYEADAQGVAAKLGLPPSAAQPLPVPAPATVSDPKDANVVVIIGTDAPVAGGGTTTTAN